MATTNAQLGSSIVYPSRKHWDSLSEHTRACTYMLYTTGIGADKMTESNQNRKISPLAHADDIYRTQNDTRQYSASQPVSPQ